MKKLLIGTILGLSIASSNLLASNDFNKIMVNKEIKSNVDFVYYTYKDKNNRKLYYKLNLTSTNNKAKEVLKILSKLKKLNCNFKNESINKNNNEVKINEEFTCNITPKVTSEIDKLNTILLKEENLKLKKIKEYINKKINLMNQIFKKEMENMKKIFKKINEEDF